MHSIPPHACTRPAVRAEIALSSEPTGVLARRYGVSTETLRIWRQRGPRPAGTARRGPPKLPWTAGEEERAILSRLAGSGPRRPPR